MSEELKERAESRRVYLRRAALLLGLLLAAIVIVNVIFSQVASVRWDLTQDGQFTLSPATVRILDGLENRVSVKVFLSKDLPAPDNMLYQRLNDMLAEFEAKSHGHLSFEIIEPETGADEAVAKGFGLRKVAVSQRDAAQRSMKLVFKGMTIIYRDAAETVAEIRANDNLEYLVAKSIVNLVKPEKKSVGVLAGFGGLGESPVLVESMRTVFEEVFGRRVSVDSVSVNERCALPENLDALIMLNLETPLTDCARYAVEQAAFRNAALIVMQSPTKGDYEQPDQPRINRDIGINALTAPLGVSFRSDLLLDRVHNLVGTQYTGDEVVEVSLPSLPVVTDLAAAHPVMQNITALVLPFSGTLDVDMARIEKAGGEAVILARSSADAVARPSGGDIGVEGLMKPRGDEVSGPHALAVFLKTPAVSQFSQNLPKGAEPSAFIARGGNVRALMVGNGEFLFMNRVIGYTDAFSKIGIHMFVNAVEWLTQDAALIEIRGRALPAMVTPPDASTQKRLIWINVAGIPLFVIVMAAVLRLIRRYRVRRIEARYAQKKK